MVDDGQRLSLKVPARRKKTYIKSRHGCSNCKLRKVKCDETKPTCKKCAGYGVLCNYSTQGSALQLAVNGPSSVCALESVYDLGRPSVTSTSVVSRRRQWIDSLSILETQSFSNHDIEILDRYWSRTSSTLTPNRVLETNRDDLVKLACSSPFLLHAVFAFTLLHDRHLSTNNRRVASTKEALHLYQFTAAFNRKISSPIEPTERDALWAAAIVLSTISFYDIDATVPEEAWPLKAPSPSDLAWLRIKDGTKEVFKLTQPMRKDSALVEVILEQIKYAARFSPVIELHNLPRELIEILGLQDISSFDSPYFWAAVALSKIINSDCGYTTVMSFISWTGDVAPEFHRLLEAKDARALLLLAYWYAKVCQHQYWWTLKRAMLECQSICLYLEKFHAHEIQLQRLLEFPKIACGIF